MTAVAILISGTGSNMVALARAIAPPHRVATVIADRTEAPGLGRAAAMGLNAQVVARQDFPTREAFEVALHAALTASGAEIVCLAGFMRILSDAFVARWAGRILNIHPSLLPRHKGLDTHARALAAGDAAHGCTVHEVTAALDDGPILGQARLTVASGDTAQSLAARVLELEHRLYPAVLARVLAGDRRRLDLA